MAKVNPGVKALTCTKQYFPIHTWGPRHWFYAGSDSRQRPFLCRTSHHTSKAQIWSSDFMFAAAMFSFVLLMFLVSWNELSLRWNNAETYSELKLTALYAADSLLTISGEPESWENMNLSVALGSMRSIGLANSRSTLNNNKLSAFKQFESGDYGTVKKMLGLSKYEMQFQLVHTTNDSIVYYSFGLNTSSLKDAAVVERPAVLNGTVVKAKLAVWRNQSYD